MTRSRFPLLLAVALGVFAACDSAREASQLTGPHSDLTVTDPTVVTTTETVETSTVTAVFGREGGNLQNGEHLLMVPRRAVTSPTEFTFTIVGGNTIHAALTAKDVATGALVTTFPQNLTLRLSYRATSVTNDSNLVVAWLVDGTVEGKKEAVPSYVDVYSKYVLGSLSHFSDFALAAD